MSDDNTKDYARGLDVLGRRAEVPAAPSRAILEAFPNPRPGSDYSVSFDCSEFTSMCPVTGQPDYGRFVIEFAPQALCLESKSLKLYLASFRSEAAFWEDVSNRIADDIFELLSPHWLRLTGHMAMRGGISITTVVRRGEGAI